MSMYNLIEYSDNYSDTSGNLWQFKRSEVDAGNNNNADITTANSLSFKYKSGLIGNIGSTKYGVKIVVPLKYLSNCWRSLEMPLINCKVELSLMWNANCILTTNPNNNNNVDGVTFKIKDAKLYVQVLTLSTKDDVKLTKQLSEGFKSSLYWNKYKVIPNKQVAANVQIRELIDASYQGVKFVLAYNNPANDANRIDVNSFKKYFLQGVQIKNYIIEIDGRNFYDKPVNDQIKRYNEIEKTGSGQGDDYTTGCLLDYKYFKENYQLLVADLSKEKALDADPRAIQQIVFTAEVETNLITYYILEQSRETVLEFYKGTAKVL